MDDRFSRMRWMIGDEGLAKLQSSFAVVVGLGAVGSYAAETLVRAGVGSVRLVDFDVVGESNLNRQLYALESTIGEKKTKIARARCLDINSACDVEVMDCFFEEVTADDVLGDVVSMDFDGSGVVVDAIDSLGPKLDLAWACHDRGLRLVSSMGAALRWDATKVRVSRLKDTRRCGLAKDMRKKLRKREREKTSRGEYFKPMNGRGVVDHWCVWSDELMGEVKGDRLASIEESGDVTRGRKRRSMGSLPTLTGMFGLTVGHTAIELLLGIRED
ncbi:tRNA threonylcarbamoyladenosine dehydratase [Planctomycetota bacterium]|nr:tRNA threonylcarbamoyladenosine dehydratase [Planctomycetota bacterium]